MIDWPMLLSIAAFVLSAGKGLADFWKVRKDAAAQDKQISLEGADDIATAYHTLKDDLVERIAVLERYKDEAALYRKFTDARFYHMRKEMRGLWVGAHALWSQVSRAGSAPVYEPPSALPDFVEFSAFSERERGE